MNLAIELNQENGRWIAEIDALNGVLVYGETREEAIRKVKTLAFRVIAERLERKLKMYLANAEKEKIVEICERNDIEFCAVFGSFARGEATEESDIDLLVRFSKPIGLFGFAGMWTRIRGSIRQKS